MKHLWCRTLWPEVHTTRMIAHLLQRPGMSVKPCVGKFDEDAKKSTKTFLIEGIPIKLEKSKPTKTQLNQCGNHRAPWPKRWWPQEVPPVVPLCEQRTENNSDRF